MYSEEECRSVSSSYTSASSAADQSEMEAAEALADLAVRAIRETTTKNTMTTLAESVAAAATKWGSKGKRLLKRVKTESPTPDSVLNSVDSRPPSLDLAEDRPVYEQKLARANCRNTKVVPVNSMQEGESKSSPVSCLPAAAGRSRQNLSEAEKEERRIRRILANRESARQTIRRRQALCEELAKKAVDLAYENENLKKEKESASKVYQSLETINKHLKEQMSKALKHKVVGEPSRGETSASQSSTCPVFLYNQHHFQQLCWPSVIQSSYPMQSQHGHQNVFMVSPSVPRPSLSNITSCQEHENTDNTTGVRAPLYIVPCPWFIPNGNGVHSQYSKDMKDEHSAKTTMDINNSASQSSLQVKEEASSLTESGPICNLNKATSSYMGLHSTEPQGSTGHALAPKIEDNHNDGATSTNLGTMLNVSVNKNQSVGYPNKKLAHTVAAAEARKRRKELTRRKNVQSFECRMHV